MTAGEERKKTKWVGQEDKKKREMIYWNQLEIALRKLFFEKYLKHSYYQTSGENDKYTYFSLLFS